MQHTNLGVGLRDVECLAVPHPPNKYWLIVPAFLVGLLVLDMRTTVKRDLQKQAGGNPVIIPDVCIHSWRAAPCVGRRGDSTRFTPTVWVGKGILQEMVIQAEGGMGGTSPWGIGFQGCDVAGRDGTATWFISVFSLEDVLLILGASMVYFK